MAFLGIGGQAPGADFAPFINSTGTDGFTQLVDESGELWERFGTSGRSTFMFINDDGQFDLTAYGVVDESELRAQAQALIDS